MATGPHYLVLDRSGTRLGGNLTAWPDDYEIDQASEPVVRKVWFGEGAVLGGDDDDEALLPAVAIVLQDGGRVPLARHVEKAASWPSLSCAL